MKILKVTKQAVLCQHDGMPFMFSNCKESKENIQIGSYIDRLGNFQKVMENSMYGRHYRNLQSQITDINFSISSHDKLNLNGDIHVSLDMKSDHDSYDRFVKAWLELDLWKAL